MFFCFYSWDVVQNIIISLSKLADVAGVLVLYVRTYCRLGKACCEACPSRLVASEGGRSGGRKPGLTLKE